jgi:hypothetical protein
MSTWIEIKINGLELIPQIKSRQFNGEIRQKWYWYNCPPTCRRMRLNLLQQHTQKLTQNVS